MPVDIPPTGDARTVADQILDGGRTLGFVTIKDERDTDEHPEQALPEQLYRMGVLARVVRVLRLPDDGLRLLCQTGRRFYLERFRRADTLLVAKVSYPPEISARNEVETKELEVLRQRLMHEVQELIRMRPDLPGEAADFVAHLEGAGPLADFAGKISCRRNPSGSACSRTWRCATVGLALIYLGASARWRSSVNDSIARSTKRSRSRSAVHDPRADQADAAGARRRARRARGRAGAAR